jgi:hypothetical protein
MKMNITIALDKIITSNNIQRSLTQHKRFVPYSTHLNFCFEKTSFMLETLDEIARINRR